MLMPKRFSPWTGLLAAAGLSVVTAITACGPVSAEGEGEGEGREGEGEGEGEGTGDCKVVEGANSVCDVQDGASPNAVGTGALVSLPGVVATSNVFGSSFNNGEPTRFNLYVSDDPNKVRSGILVQWQAAAGLPTDIAIGDVVNVTGQVSEFTLADTSLGTETRIDAQALEKAGGNSPVQPLAVTAADLNGAKAEDYEGVLVTVTGGEVVANEQFGFTLDNGLKVANGIFRYPAIVGETFTSITGVVRFDIFFGAGFELLPRQASDVVSASKPTNPITDFNDGTLPRCAGDSQFNECVAVASGIVTSAPIFLGTDATRGSSFGFYVADPANVDGDGRFGPNSGIFVTVNPFNTLEPVALNGYTFDQDENFDFTPGSAPEPGDLVEITGDNSERFGLRALRFTQSITKTGTDTLPLPALFGTGGNDPAQLKGGRPAFEDGDFSAGFDPPLEAVAASADVEQWEAVLVELAGVETTTACYAQPFDPDRNVAGNSFARDFGNFLVADVVEIGDAFRLDQSFGGFFRADQGNAIADTAKTCANVANKCQDSRAEGQVFTSLVGIVDFNFNVHRVNPRTAADIDVDSGIVAPGTGNCPN